MSNYQELQNNIIEPYDMIKVTFTASNPSGMENLDDALADLDTAAAILSSSSRPVITPSSSSSAITLNSSNSEDPPFHKTDIGIVVIIICIIVGVVGLFAGLRWLIKRKK